MKFQQKIIEQVMSMTTEQLRAECRGRDISGISEFGEQTEFVLKYGKYDGIEVPEGLAVRHEVIMEELYREIDLDLAAADEEWNAMSPEEQEYELGKDDPESEYYDVFHDCRSEDDILAKINQPGGPYAEQED
jgi:hypothetical protein